MVTTTNRTVSETGGQGASGPNANGTDASGTDASGGRWAVDPALEAARTYTWVTQLVRHAHQSPDGVALRFDGRGVTWSELADRASRVAAALVRRGVRPGDRV